MLTNFLNDWIHLNNSHFLIRFSVCFFSLSNAKKNQNVPIQYDMKNREGKNQIQIKFTSRFCFFVLRGSPLTYIVSSLSSNEKLHCHSMNYEKVDKKIWCVDDMTSMNEYARTIEFIPTMNAIRHNFPSNSRCQEPNFKLFISIYRLELGFLLLKNCFYTHFNGQINVLFGHIFP